MLRTIPKSATPGDVYFIDSPTYDNLYFIRLLPSYYKKELLRAVVNKTVDNWGYNQTFNDYIELFKELEKACLNDIVFNINTHYYPANVVIDYKQSENKFTFQGQNINTAPIINDIPVWDTEATYAPGALVFYDLTFYIAVNTSTGVVPTPTMTVPWVIRKFPNYYTTWYFNQPYNVGNVVQYDGIFYLCLAYNLSEDAPPFNLEKWLDVSQYFVNNPYFNSYLIAGYQDPNVDTLLQFIQQQSQSLFRDNAVISIPGQPYVPQQTLSRRMGFTWDCNGMIYDANTINTLLTTTGIPFGSTVALFFNRLRPVLQYDVGNQELDEEDLSLGAFYDNDRLYYTADGYCNLVYSSIINIYTTVVGTSTVDTQRNANLLAMIELDCGNLGVAMVGNYIDTKLTKIQGDIYSIYIELRDEVGQPYYLTNNATTTLLIKLTY
jgi:hypothetical protein